MKIKANITGISYQPFLCRELNLWDLDQIKDALSKESSFILKLNDTNKIAVSWWVSSKRTRSYPYARVYDTLSFIGKKVTIIPVIKDEGKEGDRDFLQWDTVSLMSLLGIHVIISYYKEASQSPRYKHKITKQIFDINHIENNINRLLSYQSDALHWNLLQVNNVANIAEKALDSYINISNILGVKMHSESAARRRISELIKEKNSFMVLSRGLAQKAQEREMATIQPKELLNGTKATLTINNYLGGYYYFTSDEIILDNNDVYLIEGKHTCSGELPSVGDIKDGLLKMILFTNLENVMINDKIYNSIPALRLTNNEIPVGNMSKKNKKILSLLKKEANLNKFKIFINNELI
jgi:hypothetical protein